MRFFIILSCLLLTGCAVTIDEVQQEEQLNDELLIQQDESASEEQPLLDFLDDLLPFNKQHSVYYLALGDSLTRGVGDEEDNYGFTGRLAQHLEEQPTIAEVHLENRGKNGRRSDQLLNLLERGHYDEQLEKANLVTITLGGNDVMKIVKRDVFNLKEKMFLKELTPFEERYREIIAAIRARNADVPIIMVGFYNPFAIITDETKAFNGILNAWNDTIESVSSEDHNACYVPVEDLFKSNDDLIYHTDFFHPNANGYNRMTKRVIEKLHACDIEKMSEGLIRLEE